VRTGTRLGPTDRGTLRWADRNPGRSRILRLVDERLCDDQFKNELTVIRAQERPRMVNVVRAGYVGDHFSLEYTVEGDCQTLEERMAAAPDWRSRLMLVQEVCATLRWWMRCPVRPLGLTVRDIVLIRGRDKWHPWLLPCPPVRASPRDLLELDERVLATVAPETLRGVFADARQKDAYAVGTLAAQAVRWGVRGALRARDSVTEQARNALLHPTAGDSEIPAVVADREAGHRLFAMIDRYRHRDPSARPADAAQLGTALRDVTDVLSLADSLGDTADARDLLCLPSPAEGDAFVRGHLRAVQISVRLGQLDRATELAERLTREADEVREGWRRLVEVLWLRVEPEPGLRRHDPLVKQLSAALDTAKAGPGAGAEPYRIACQLHLRLGEDHEAAEEAYEAAERDWTDFAALLLYRDCLLRLQETETAAEVVREARRRVTRVVDAGRMSEGEGRRWHERFGD
jgi:hypothetical protein